MRKPVDKIEEGRQWAMKSPTDGAKPAETGAPRKTTRVEPDPAEMAAQVLTLGDVAKRLHKSPRWLRDYLRGWDIGKMAGRTPIFVEADVAAIFESLPSPNPLP